MKLSQYLAEVRRRVFEDLSSGLAPSDGEYNAQLLAECSGKGKPQMGAVTYHPSGIALEFIYKNLSAAPSILVVTLTTPERIVFMPVPEWVVQSIWQGEISGSYHFESEAIGLLQRFEASLQPEYNASLFNVSEMGVKN